METLKILAEKATSETKEIIILVLALDNNRLKLLCRLCLARLVELNYLPLPLLKVIELSLGSGHGEKK